MVYNGFKPIKALRSFFTSFWIAHTFKFIISYLHHKRIHFLTSLIKIDHNICVFICQKLLSGDTIYFLPLIYPNLMAFSYLFIESFLFSIPNSISFVVSWGEYWGRNTILNPNLLTTCFVNLDKRIEALSRGILVWVVLIRVQSSINLWTIRMKFQNCSESVVLLLMYEPNPHLKIKQTASLLFLFPKCWWLGCSVLLESTNILSLLI